SGRIPPAARSSLDRLRSSRQSSWYRAPPKADGDNTNRIEADDGQVESCKFKIWHAAPRVHCLHLLLVIVKVRSLAGADKERWSLTEVRQVKTLRAAT